MATYYVSSVSGDNTDGSTWAKAFTSLTSCLAAATGVGPHLIYIDSAHSVTGAGAVTIDAATGSAQIVTISVNRNGSTTTGHAGWLAGATEASPNAASLTVGSANRSQFLWFYGVTFSTNSGSSNSNDLNIATGSINTNSRFEFVNCKLKVLGTGATAQLQFGPSSSYSGMNTVILRNTELTTKNAATSPAIVFRCATVDCYNITHVHAGGTKAPSLFSFSAASNETKLRIFDSDLSGFSGATAYFDFTNFAIGMLYLVNCKLSGTPALTTGSFSAGNASLTVLNSDSGDTHNVYSYYTIAGTLTIDNSIYRDNGARFDGAGVSWKVVTTAACDEYTNFVVPFVKRWHDGTSSVAIGMEMIFDNATDLTDRQCWVDFETLENASFPLSTLTTTRCATQFDSGGANLSASTEAWTGAGGFTNSKKRYVSITGNPAEKSMLLAKMTFAVASRTFYVDPCLTIAGAGNNPATRWLQLGAVNEVVVGGAANFGFYG